MSLEHDDQLVLASEVARDFQAVRLNFGNAHVSQARHFSRVRSDDDGSSATVQLAGRALEGVEPVRIHNDRLDATLDDCADEFSSLGVAGDAWANCDQGLLFQQLIKAWSERSQ